MYGGCRARGLRAPVTVSRLTPRGRRCRGRVSPRRLASARARPALTVAPAQPRASAERASFSTRVAGSPRGTVRGGPRLSPRPRCAERSNDASQIEPCALPRPFEPARILPAIADPRARAWLTANCSPPRNPPQPGAHRVPVRAALSGSLDGMDADLARQPRQRPSSRPPSAARAESLAGAARCNGSALLPAR